MQRAASMKPKAPKLIKRKDLGIVPHADKVTIYRTFPLQSALEMPLAAYNLFEHVLALQSWTQKSPYSKKEFSQMVQTFKTLDLFETPQIEQKRKNFFEENIGKNGTLDLSERLHSLEQPKNIKKLLRKSFSDPQTIEGLLLPHATCTQEQVCQALEAFNKHNWPDLFVILATNHYSKTPSILEANVTLHGATLEVDQSFAYFVKKHSSIPFVKNAHWFYHEHSWNLFLPLLFEKAKCLQRPLKILPILFSSGTLKEAKNLAAVLRRVQQETKQTISVLASGDLNHFGPVYQKLSWIKKSKNTTRKNIQTQILKKENHILKLVEQNKPGQFYKTLGQTTFCARAQLATLMFFANRKGKVINHEAYVNFKPQSKENLKKLEPTDIVYSTACVVFSESGQTFNETQKAKKNLFCPKVRINKTDAALVIFHPCDQVQLALPLKYESTLMHLIRGRGKKPSPDVLKVLKEKLLQEGYKSHQDLFNQEYRKRKIAQFFKTKAKSIPFYASRNIQDFSNAPITISKTIIDHWHDFFVKPFVWNENDKEKYYTRNTSGSSGGKQLRTVVEHASMNLREAVVGGVNPYFNHAVVANINRPANLFGRANVQSWPHAVREKNSLRISPGPNVTQVTNEVLDQTIAKIKAHKPESIHGAPEYVAVLAQRVLDAKITFKNLRSIDLGHNFLWSPQRKIIEKAFGVPVFVKYHSSEFGPMGVECEHFNMHLVERKRHVELLNLEGKPARLGELCMPVFSVFDSDLRPIFRYNQGDVLQYVSKQCECGRPFEVVKVLGRAKDLVKNAQGHFVTYPDINAVLNEVDFYFHFTLEINPESIQLKVLPAHAKEVFPKNEIIEQLKKLYGRKVMFEQVHTFDHDNKAKFISVKNNDTENTFNTQFWNSIKN